MATQCKVAPNSLPAFDLHTDGPSASPQSLGVLYGEQHFIAAPPGEPGVQLFARQWRPHQGPCRAQVVIVHGYMEHGGRYRELAHSFAAHGIATLCVDLRGHGRSDGQRGYVDDFDAYTKDVLGTLHAFGEAPTFLLGHSLGGLISLDLVARYAPAMQGLIVTNPYLDNARPPPAYKLWIGKQAGRVLPRLSLPSGLPRDGLTHDMALLRQHARDPLVFTHANAAWFREVGPAQARVRAINHLDVPLFYIYSDADPIALPRANAELAAQIHASDKQVLLRAGELHEVLNEVRRADLFALITQWLVSRI